MNYIMSKDQKKKRMSKPRTILSPSREEFLATYEKNQYGKFQRGWLERWFDRHNHKMEFLRTISGLLTLALQGVIIAKLFGLF